MREGKDGYRPTGGANPRPRPLTPGPSPGGRGENTGKPFILAQPNSAFVIRRRWIDGPARGEEFPTATASAPRTPRRYFIYFLDASRFLSYTRQHADQTLRIGPGSGRSHRPRTPPFRRVHQPGTRRRRLPGAHLALLGSPRPRPRPEQPVQRRRARAVRHHPRPLRQGARQVPRPAAGVPPVRESRDRPCVGGTPRLRLGAARRHAVSSSAS